MKTDIANYTRLLVVWALCTLGCEPEDNNEIKADSGMPLNTDSDNEMDTNTETETESDTSSESDTCYDNSLWISLCGAAETEVECKSANTSLPDLNVDCDKDDASHSCSWLPIVATSLDGEGRCVFGPQRFICAYVSAGEGNYGQEPPCDGINDNSKFYQILDGGNFTGYAPGSAHRPEPYPLYSCNLDDAIPGICDCICEPDYPIQTI